MDISSIATAAANVTTAQTGQSVQIALLKKTMEIQAQAAATLISAMDASAKLPEHLGQNINTTA